MNINEILKTEKSRKNFLKGLIALSKADGSVEESEKGFFAGAAASLQLSIESQQEVNLSWSEEVGPYLEFDNKREKLFFFIQAIQLCTIDNSYSDKEREFVYTLASNLDISREAIKKIEEWVSEGIQWQIKGESLLEMEE